MPTTPPLDVSLALSFFNSDRYNRPQEVTPPNTNLSLITAVQLQQLGNVRALLGQKNANPNAIDHLGRTPLHHAVIQNDAAITEALLLHPDTNPNIKAYEEGTPLNLLLHHQPSSHARNQCLKVLLKWNAANLDPNDSDRLYQRPASDLVDEQTLHEAIEANDIAMVKHLLETGAEVNAQRRTPHDKQQNGDTPLTIATKRGNQQMAQLLLDKGADPNKKGSGGLTPLHYATTRGIPDVMEILFTHPAINPNLHGDRTGSPLSLLLKRQGRSKRKTVDDCLNILLKWNAANTTGSEFEKTAYVKPINPKKTFIWTRKAYLNAKENKRIAFYNTLHDAVAAGDILAVEAFIDIGTDINGYINPQNRDHGDTPLTTAIQYQHLDIVEFLLAKGADPNIMGHEDFTPLHYAAKHVNADIMKALFTHPAINPNFWVGITGTPLNLLLRCHNQIEATRADDCLNLLLKWNAANLHGTASPKLYLRPIKPQKSFIWTLQQYLQSLETKKVLSYNTLHDAVETGNIPAVEAFLDIGTDVDCHVAPQTKAHGDTPLTKAVHTQNIEMIRFLLSRGANPNKMGDQDHAPLHYAALHGNADIITTLIAHPAIDLNLKAFKHGTALNMLYEYTEAIGIEKSKRCCDILMQWGAANLSEYDPDQPYFRPIAPIQDYTQVKSPPQKRVRFSSNL